jgi:ADP-glucose pyrophosphorylase
LLKLRLLLRFQPPSGSVIGEWGLTGAVAIIVLQNAWKWFHSKEDEESKLVKSLVDGLQSNQAKLLEQLVATQTKQYEAISELKEAIVTLGASVRQDNQSILKQHEEAIARLTLKLHQLEK